MSVTKIQQQSVKALLYQLVSLSFHGSSIQSVQCFKTKLNKRWSRHESVATDLMFASVQPSEATTLPWCWCSIYRSQVTYNWCVWPQQFCPIREFPTQYHQAQGSHGFAYIWWRMSPRFWKSQRRTTALHRTALEIELYYQHQNFAEHRWGHFKRNHWWCMNYRNVHPRGWLLCAKCISIIMNYTAERSLRWSDGVHPLKFWRDKHLGYCQIRQESRWP